LSGIDFIWYVSIRVWNRRTTLKERSIFRFILILSVFTCFSGCKHEETGSGSQDVSVPVFEVKAGTDRTVADVSDTIKFTLSVLYVPSVTIHMPEIGEEIAGLRIVDFGQEGPEHVDSHMVYRKWYKLHADIAGTYIIPEMVVSCAGPDVEKRQVRTPKIFLEIKDDAAEPESKKPEDIIGIKPLEVVPRSMKPFIIAGAATAIVLAIVLGLYLYMRERRKTRVVVRKPAHVLAFEELGLLQKEKLIEKGRIKEHYFRLSDIFRKYLENRFCIPAVESTTQELVSEIKKLEAMDETVKSDTRQFLNHSDMVKFAKHIPAVEEIKRNHGSVIGIINKTKKEEIKGDEHAEV
jgi:hypothetical protein